MTTYDIIEAEPLHAQELIDAGWTVLDVRSDAEWAEGHVPHATHMALADVVAGVGGRGLDPVLLVTSDGGKGWRVAQYLKQEGLEVGNLAGGMFAWELAGLPVER